MAIIVGSARQNFPPRSENDLNGLIDTILSTSHVYVQLYSYYLRDGINLNGIARYMRKRHDYLQEWALSIVEYVTLRGGITAIDSIPRPLTAPPSLQAGREEIQFSSFTHP
jgi:ferritin